MRAELYALLLAVKNNAWEAFRFIWTEFRFLWSAQHLLFLVRCCKAIPHEHIAFILESSAETIAPRARRQLICKVVQVCSEYKHKDVVKALEAKIYKKSLEESKSEKGE